MNIDTCFWCLKPLDDDKEIVKGQDTMVFHSYTPCKRCQEIFKNGIMVMGTEKAPIQQGMPPIMESDDLTLYPTGSILLMSEADVRAMLSEESEQELLKNVLESGKMLMPEENVQRMIDTVKQMGAKNIAEGEEEMVDGHFETETVENKLGIPIE